MHSGYNYKFQAQELQDELALGWFSSKWRNYDPALARFLAIDTLTETYEDYTPYQFASNQPVHAQEVEGLENAHDLNKRVQPEKLSVPGRRLYLLLWNVEVDYHFPTITILKMQKMPFMADPRYGHGDQNQYKAQQKLREDVSMTERAPYPQEQEINLPRHKMKKD